MSGSTATATRRQIRRALGPAGLEAVNGVALHVTQELGPLVAQHDRQLDSLYERVVRLETEQRNRAELTLWQRLAWLAKGV